jgi:DNA mismatch repair protein MutS
MSEEYTPIRQQYLDIKKQYPDTILFFRLGDFYETFDQDAEITSRELDLVLTSRNVAKGSRVPMAGIPYHAVENYLAIMSQSANRWESSLKKGCLTAKSCALSHPAR